METRTRQKRKPCRQITCAQNESSTGGSALRRAPHKNLNVPEVPNCWPRRTATAERRCFNRYRAGGTEARRIHTKTKNRKEKMKLMTKALAKSLPPIGETAEEKNPIVHGKWFCPWGNWTWYATEYDAESGNCFGLVEGHEVELGYLNLNELREISGPFGLKIERDLHWKPTPLDEVKKRCAPGWPNY